MDGFDPAAHVRVERGVRERGAGGLGRGVGRELLRGHRDPQGQQAAPPAGVGPPRLGPLHQLGLALLPSEPEALHVRPLLEVLQRELRIGQVAFDPQAYIASQGASE